MDTYIYAADCYCPECAEDIKQRLRKSGKEPADSKDENTYDSDDWPKGPYEDGGGESDVPQHCGSGEDCINAIELAAGVKVGAFLGNPLTRAGEDYVLEKVEEDHRNAVCMLWSLIYCEEIKNAKARRSVLLGDNKERR